MRSRTSIPSVIVLAALVAAAAGPAPAEDFEKKFRIGLGFGGMNGLDSIDSDAANVLRLVDENLVPVNAFVDPRDDSSVFGSLDVQAGPIATISAQYAVTKVFVVEASVGYQKTDLGDVEMQAQFFGQDIPELRGFDFRTYRIRAGDIERVPVQLTFLARFRPRATFNPYIGIGVGYAFLGFDPADEFNELSYNMDASRGGQTRLTSAFLGVPLLINPPVSQDVDLRGATVDVEDTFEWNIAGGAEYTFKPKWAAYLDLRYVKSSNRINVGFNGGDYLGTPVPQYTTTLDSPLATATYGAITIRNGGLIDDGSIQLRPVETAPVGTDCALTPRFCEDYFEFGMPDGEPDPGFYYVQGGSLKLDGLALQVGVRFAF